MNFIIDGYNLLHAMGALRGRAGPGGLEQARHRLVGLLKGAFAEDVGALTVVFDASHAPSDVPTLTSAHGVRIRFARGEEADDLIETLIEEHSAPRNLTVVSNDNRLRRAARRRRAHGMSCESFVRLLAKRREHRPASAGEKLPLADADSKKLLDEFAFLDEELRREFDPFDFESP